MKLEKINSIISVALSFYVLFKSLYFIKQSIILNVFSVIEINYIELTSTATIHTFFLMLSIYLLGNPKKLLSKNPYNDFEMIDGIGWDTIKIIGFIIMQEYSIQVVGSVINYFSLIEHQMPDYLMISNTLHIIFGLLMIIVGGVLFYKTSSVYHKLIRN